MRKNQFRKAVNLTGLLLIDIGTKIMDRQQTIEFCEAIEEAVVRSANEAREQRAARMARSLDAMFSADPNPDVAHDPRCAMMTDGMPFCDCGFWRAMDKAAPNNDVKRVIVDPPTKPPLEVVEAGNPEPEDVCACSDPPQTHVIEYHQQDEQYRCSCGAMFSSEGALRVHQIDDHADDDD